MAVIRWSGFTGENRALHPKLLGDGQCTTSLNQKPGRGDLRPWREALTVATVPAGRKTIYRMGRDVNSDSQYWLSWPSRVHAMRGFEAENTTERTYFTGDGVPKVTDNTIALASAPYPTASRLLGVPAPASALIVSGVSGTYTGASAEYYYAYTYVNDWGWESATSPPSAVLTRKTDQSATISNVQAPPSGNYGINRVRIYRTQAGSNSTAGWFFLREIALGVSSTTDDNRQVNDQLATSSWAMPPSDLKYLTPLWNGMAAGISGSSVRLCVAYSLYAWPLEYEVLPPDSTPVALGVVGQQLLVLTTGRPLLVSGSSPEAMDQAPLEMSQGCVSADSAVSMGQGVAWASEDGLCWYGAGGPRVLTAGDPARGIPPLLKREDWQAMNPATVTGKMYEGLYFGGYLVGGVRKGFFLDPMNPTGIYFLETGFEACHFDELKDQLYVLDGSNIKRWDAASTFLNVTAISKVWPMPYPLNMAITQVVADNYPVQVQVFGDGVLRADIAITSADPQWLPGGYTARDWQIKATGALQGVAVATTLEEIKQT